MCWTMSSSGNGRRNEPRTSYRFVNWDILRRTKMIHPTATIDSRARLDPTVNVGPYAVIDGQVIAGANCRIGPHVHLTGQTRIGAGNVFHTGCVIGDAPQDLKYKGESTRLRIGEHN